MTTMLRVLKPLTLGVALLLTSATLARAAEDDGFIPVESSVIDSVKYDGSAHVLTLRLDDGEEIRFLDVPKKVYAEFMDVRTKGGFVKGRLIPDFESESSFDDMGGEAPEAGEPSAEAEVEPAPEEDAAPVAVEPPATEPLSVDTTKAEVVEDGDLPAAAPAVEEVFENQGENVEDVLKQAVDDAAEPVPEPAMEAAPAPEPVAEAVAEVEAAVEEVAEPVAAVEEVPVPEPVAEAVAEVEAAVEEVAEPVAELEEIPVPVPEPALQTELPAPPEEQTPAVSTDETDVLEDLLDELE